MSRPKRAVHALGRHRELGEPHPGRVLHGVGNGGGDRDGPGFAETLCAERTSFVHGLDQRDQDLGHVRRREELVVEKPGIQHAPLPEAELLGEAVAEPHVDPALDLALAARPD